MSVTKELVHPNANVVGHPLSVARRAPQLLNGLIPDSDSLLRS